MAREKLKLQTDKSLVSDSELQQPREKNKNLLGITLRQLDGGSVKSIVWALFVFPDSGNIAERGQYFWELLNSDRLTIAFVVDLVLFWIFQVILVGTVMPADSKNRWFRWVPFGGLAAWLVF